MSIIRKPPAWWVEPTYVPPGWTDWAVPIRGQFNGTDYDLNLNGRIVHKEAPRDYRGFAFENDTIGYFHGTYRHFGTNDSA